MSELKPQYKFGWGIFIFFVQKENGDEVGGAGGGVYKHK